MTAAELAERLDATRSGAGWMARCPAHEDRVPSLSISEGREGRVLLKCQAGCALEAVLGGLGLTKRDLFDANGRGPGAPLRQEVAAYDYRDELDTLLYQVVRFLPKAFKQRRPDGHGEWIWNLHGVRRVLYRLPALLDRSAGAPVWVVEGEKDADTLTRHGLAATTNACGVKNWRPEYSAALKGAHVIIVPDTDAPGLAHGEEVARQLHGTAASVRVLTLPRGKDVTEFLELGGTVDELTALAAAAPAWAPAAADRHRRDAVAAGPGAATAAPAAAPTGHTRAPAASPTDAEADDTDSGNATRLVALHGAQLHYIARWGTWLVWSPAQGRWQLDYRECPGPRAGERRGPQPQGDGGARGLE